MQQYQLFALVSMVFAGLTSVIAKAGLKNVGGDAGLAVRTLFVFKRTIHLENRARSGDDSGRAFDFDFEIKPLHFCPQPAYPCRDGEAD